MDKPWQDHARSYENRLYREASEYEQAKDEEVKDHIELDVPRNNEPMEEDEDEDCIGTEEC